MVIRNHIDSFYLFILDSVADSLLCHFRIIILDGYQMDSQQFCGGFDSGIGQGVCSQLIPAFQQCAQRCGQPVLTACCQQNMVPVCMKTGFLKPGRAGFTLQGGSLRVLVGEQVQCIRPFQQLFRI